MQSPPASTKRVRLTISVPENVHAAYRHMADVTGRSIGLEMGEWLDATLLAALNMTERMAEAREAPRLAVQQINSLTSALESVERVRLAARDEDLGGPTRRPAQPGGRSGGAIPPSSNTGGKPPKQHSRVRSK